MCVSVSCVNSSGSGRGEEGTRYTILNFPVDRAETRNKERKQNAAGKYEACTRKTEKSVGKKKNKVEKE